MADLTRRVLLQIAAQNKAKGIMAGFSRDLTSTGRAVRRLATRFLALAGIGGMGYMIKKTMTSIDQIAKMSDELQLSTEALTGWEHAAKISGTSIESLHKAIEIFVRRMGEAKHGVGEGVRGLKMLNLSAQEVISMGTEKAFLMIAERISQAGTAAEQAGIAYNFFGKQGTQLLNMFQQGSSGIEAMRTEAEKLGLTFSRLDAAKVEAANDALTRTQALFTGLFRRTTIELAPYIEAAANSFVDFATQGRGVAHNVTLAFETISLSVVSTTAEVENLLISLNKLTSPIDYLRKLGEAERLATERYRQMTGEKTAGERLIVPRLGGVTVRRQPKDFDLYNKILLEEKAALNLIAENRESVIRKTFERFRNDAEARAKVAATTAHKIANKEIEQTEKATEAYVDLWDKAMRKRKELWLGGLSETEAMERDQMRQMGWVMDQAEYRFKSFWDPVIDGSKSAKEATRDFFRDFFLNMAKAHAYTAMTPLWHAAVGPVLGAITGATFRATGTAAGGATAATPKLWAEVAHGGGIVGEIGNRRMVPMPTFVGAPRLHEGLRADERPVIMQTGEEVIERGGSGGMVIHNHINIKAWDTQDVQRGLAKQKNYLSDLMMATLKSNHPMRRVDR